MMGVASPFRRVVSWFSCGRASAVATYLALQQYGPATIIAYCESVKDWEHSDNGRFIADCERWFGKKILRLRADEYIDPPDVWRRTRWLVGPGGARCTTELKKKVRFKFQRPDDIQIFGLDAAESKRIERFKRNNHDIDCRFPLYARGLTGRDCNRYLAAAGIALPTMYRLGYRNNNCIGCVKGGAGYWNKIRVDFPKRFAYMAQLERELGVAICKTEPVVDGKRQRIRVFLDELDPAAGRYKEEPTWECGVACGEN